MKLSRETLQIYHIFGMRKLLKFTNSFNSKVAWNEKKGENICIFGFSYSKNMVKFEAFRITISLNINL